MKLRNKISRVYEIGKKNKILFSLKKKKIGCILGKFYPLHKGHEYLIKSGMAECDILYVILVHRSEEVPNGHIRYGWLSQMYGMNPRIKIMEKLVDGYPSIDPYFWAKKTIDYVGRAPDVVISSEDYGEWAKMLGCRHVQVDVGRECVPISGTMIRENPVKYFEYMSPCVRSWYSKVVVVTGPRMSGKTTLMRVLVKEMGELCPVGMVGDQSEKLFCKMWAWDDDYKQAAYEQNVKIMEAKKNYPLVISDTDWLYYRIIGESDLGNFGGVKVDLYLLTKGEEKFEECLGESNYRVLMNGDNFVSDAIKYVGEIINKK